MPEGCENCERMDETSVAKKMICHVPELKTNRMAPMDKPLKRSHQTIVRFGRHLSANVPPMKENRKIGRNSAKDIIDTANAFPWVFCMTNRSTPKFRAQMPICKNTPEIMMVRMKRLRSNPSIEAEPWLKHSLPFHLRSNSIPILAGRSRNYIHFNMRFFMFFVVVKHHFIHRF